MTSKFDIDYSAAEHGKFLEYLEQISDKKFKDFTQKLLLTKYEVLGVKVPQLKELAKIIARKDLRGYLNACTFSSFEETLIYGLLLNYLPIEQILEKFLFFAQKIDSWGFTDTVIASLKKVKKNKEAFLSIIERLLKDGEFSVRSAYVFMLDYYICDEYVEYVFEKLNEDYDGYYVKMAKAWLASLLYLKYPEKTKDFLSRCSDNFVVNKTISKIRDSFRVSDINKKELLAYKR